MIEVTRDGVWSTAAGRLPYIIELKSDFIKHLWDGSCGSVFVRIPIKVNTLSP